MAAEPTTSPRAWLVPLLLTATAYAVAGWLALLLAIPPGYASPLWPAAGIALACVLRYGRGVIGGVALGSFAANIVLGAARGLLDVPALVLPAAIAAGAAAQAALGAWLIGRFVRQPLALREGGDVLRFLALGAPLACLCNASVGTAALVVSGTVAPAEAASTWLTWWAGDSLGVLIAAPVVLTLIGEPRADWIERRDTVGLPLAMVTVLLALAIVQVARWDEQRTRGVFERDATSAAAALASGLEDPLDTLQALHDLISVKPDLTREQMRRTSTTWLGNGLPPQAIGWTVRVPRDGVAALEASARADGLAGYRVFDRADATTTTAEVLAIRYIEPLERNRAALGVNVLSVPAAHAAIERMHDSGAASASAGFTLTQEAGDQTGVVVYHPVYDGDPRDAVQRAAALRGAMFLTMRMGDVLGAVARGVPSYLRLCLLDADLEAPRRVLAGAPGCDQPVAGDLEQSGRIDFAGRRWELRIAAAPQRVPGGSQGGAWLFSLVGLLATAMLGALLLTMSGRARRIESAVRERTTELEHEIDERARTETALRESEQRLRNILDHAPIGVIYTDLRGYTRDSNPRFRAITGYSADELGSMVALELTHRDDRAADAELAGRLVRGEIPLYRRRKRYLRKDGSVVWVQSIVSLLRHADGRPHRIVGVVEDISEHLRLQQAEDARALAEAANRAKSDFLSRMSHELRTPLNAMLGFTQLLELDRQAPLTVTQRGWTGQVQQAGWHLLHMINDTLDLSRIESGTLRLEIRPLELAPLIAAARSMVEPQARERGIVLDEQAAASLLAVRGDDTRTKQILTNLLSNAVKYNVDGGRVDIVARVVPGSMVEIEVIDSGPGLSPQQLAELFQPFNRLGRESSGIEGTGIGLVISQRLAELMGGALRARSTEGEGSTFVLTLPLAVDIDPTTAERHDETQPDLPRYRRRHVLYVEDNETNAEVMRGILLQRTQVELRIAGTAEDAFAALDVHTPDLILLDMHLPDMDGLELLERLKSTASTAPIPVVVVSADATAERIGDALSGGAERYLTKPVNVAELLGVVDELLEAQDTRF